MCRVTALAALAFSVSAAAPAATTTVVLPVSTIAAWTGDLSDSDPYGLAFDGSALYFFEDQSVANGDPLMASKSLIRCAWPEGTLSVHLTHNHLRAITARPAAAFTLLDTCALPGGAVALVIMDIYTGNEFLVACYLSGVSTLLVQNLGAQGAAAITYDAAVQRLLVLMTTQRGAPSPGLAYVDLAGSLPATSLTLLTSGASLEAVLTTTGTPQWAPSDLAAQSDGDTIIVNHGPDVGNGGDLGSDGDAVRVTRTGAVSLFYDRALLDGITGDPGTTGYGAAAIIADASGALWLAAFEDDQQGATCVSEFLARIAPDGATATMVRTEEQILADLGSGSTDLSMTRHGLVRDNAGNLLWSANGSGIPQGILMISDPAPAELSVFAAE